MIILKKKVPLTVIKRITLGDVYEVSCTEVTGTDEATIELREIESLRIDINNITRRYNIAEEEKQIIKY